MDVCVGGGGEGKIWVGNLGKVADFFFLVRKFEILVGK